MMNLLLVTTAFTLSLAILTGLQKYLDKLIYWNKFKMNDFFLQMVSRKGLTTDYRNQENEHFRKLQSESFSSCNGNFSYYAQTYDSAVLFFSNLAGFVAFTGILMSLNPLLILFLCATTLISFILNRRLLKWVDTNNEEKVGYEQRMQYIIRASDDIQAAKDIRLYHMTDWMDRIYKENIGMIWKNQITVAEFVLYFNLVAGFSVWLSSILGQMNNLKRLSMAMNRFRSYLEYPEYYKREDGIPVEKTDAPGVITFENVSFSYTDDGEAIIKDMNLNIKAGEHLAIVGLNGAGKTTLAKLICGLTDPTKGRVLYNGTDVKELNRIQYYKLFGAVFQDYSVLPVTIEEIVAEETEEKADSELVEKCLKQAGLWEKISALDNGIKTKFDRAFWDDGINLSGGEKQKLLLARALYKQTPVVILDEPTAALDPIAENNLYESYDEIMKNKTTVFISHRLASTRFCNRILLIENGKIVEEGTHDQLLKKGGIYSKLFETQAKYYREGKESTDEDSKEN